MDSNHKKSNLLLYLTSNFSAIPKLPRLNKYIYLLLYMFIYIYISSALYVYIYISSALYVCDVMLLYWPRWLTLIGPHDPSYVLIITGPLGPCTVFFFLIYLCSHGCLFFISSTFTNGPHGPSFLHVAFYCWPTWPFFPLPAWLAFISLLTIWPAWQFPNIACIPGLC